MIYFLHTSVQSHQIGVGRVDTIRILIRLREEKIEILLTLQLPWARIYHQEDSLQWVQLLQRHHLAVPPQDHRILKKRRIGYWFGTSLLTSSIGIIERCDWRHTFIVSIVVVLGRTEWTIGYVLRDPCYPLNQAGVNLSPGPFPNNNK